jgi:hypothetical protein
MDSGVLLNPASGKRASRRLHRIEQVITTVEWLALRLTMPCLLRGAVAVAVGALTLH